MDERFYSEEESPDILGHLLEIEARASVLVDDAQAEADRRLKDAEEKNRAAYEERYRVMIEALEAEYRNQLAVVQNEYRLALDEYRAGLAGMPLHEAEFSALAESFFFGEA
ncbi:MAG: hypothetical protein LBB82_01820 [Treponema sp.]|jgi:23S rRNA maturation-related 3'-5' exoribonuclease YhaM|nr:hypothetical protein [Treponema sp.]